MNTSERGNYFRDIAPDGENRQLAPEENITHPDFAISRRKFLLGLSATLLVGSATKPEILKGLLSLFSRKKKDAENFTETETLEPEESFPELKPSNKKEKVANTPEEIAEKVLAKYNELFEKKDFIPKEIFTDNFFIATQLQESGYNSKARSSAGAFGVMQTMPTTIKEVVRILDVFERKELIQFASKKWDDMTQEDVQEIKKLIQENNNYGRAFGKLYFSGLYKLHGIGEKEREQENIKKAQQKLLASYNWNPEELKKHEDNERAWPKESKDYYKRIFRNINYLELTQKKIKEFQIKSNSNYMSMRIVQAMLSYDKISEHDELFDELLNKYIENLKLSEDARHRELKDNEIDDAINLTRSQLIRTYVSETNHIKNLNG